MTETIKSIEEVAREIENYVDYVSVLQLMSKEMNAGISASPLINFKDALWHYSVLYETAGQEKQLPLYYCNVYALEEHLYIGLQDITLYILCVLKQRIRRFISFNSSSYKKKSKPRALLNDLKILELKIKNDPDLFSLRKIEEAILELKDLYERTVDACRELGIERNIIKGL